MSNKPNQKPSIRYAEAKAKAKAPHVEHLHRIRTALSAVGLETNIAIIDIILKFDKACREKGDTLTIADFKLIGMENQEWHKA
jgi:hypothetical protein